MKNMYGILLLNLLILFGCANKEKQTLSSENQNQTKQKPNIIFILVDDLGYGDVGAYGQEVIQTPYIDKLAAEGMKFTQAYAGSTVCAPSRCAFLTGYHMGKAIIRNNGISATGERVSLPDSALTVAEVLQAQGYSTGIFGKWGLGEIGSEGLPNNQGFDEFYGYISQGRAHKYFVDYAWHNSEKSLRILLKRKRMSLSSFIMPHNYPMPKWPLPKKTCNSTLQQTGRVSSRKFRTRGEKAMGQPIYLMPPTLLWSASLTGM
jgi:hypothetical protein